MQGVLETQKRNIDQRAHNGTITRSEALCGVALNELVARNAIVVQLNPRGPGRRSRSGAFCQTTDFAHETLFVPVCPKIPSQWPHRDSMERNLCLHDPLSICPHTENFVKNLKLISTQLKPRALPDHLRIFQIKLYTQSSFLRTNSAASYYAQVANVCPICRQGQDNLHKHILKTCTPVKAAKRIYWLRRYKTFCGWGGGLWRGLADIIFSRGRQCLRSIG